MGVVTEGRENEAGGKRLSRTAIAHAAVGYIDRHGAQGLIRQFSRFRLCSGTGSLVVRFCGRSAYAMPTG